MKDLNTEMARFLKEKKNPTSERAHTIQMVCDTFFSDKDFKKILMQTKNFTVEEIQQIFGQAKAWEKNPPALFWKLVGEKRTEIQQQLKEAEKGASKE